MPDNACFTWVVSKPIHIGGDLATPFLVNDIHMLHIDITLDIKGIFDNYSKLHIHNLQIRHTI